jgi:glycosyltransferase involved in cell wall biosynthesis
MVYSTPVCSTAFKGKQIAKTIVSIIIPAYNEEKNLGNVLVELHNDPDLAKIHHEILVVDDGSTDNTKEIASRNGVKVLSNKINQGKGHSLKVGFEHAKGEFIITMDADGSHDPKDIKKLLLPVLNGSDIAIGTRFNTSEGRKTTTTANLFGNYLINLVLMIITGAAVTDSQSGFRAYKSKVLKEITISSKGFEIETELTLKPIRNGYSLKEVPIFVRDRKNGLSHVKPIRDGLRIFKELILMSIINK